MTYGLLCIMQIHHATTCSPAKRLDGDFKKRFWRIPVWAVVLGAHQIVIKS